MCLLTNEIDKKKADKPIRVFKVMIENKDCVESIFYTKRYNLGEKYITKMYIPQSYCQLSLLEDFGMSKDKPCFEVEYGFHSYKNLGDAVNLREILISTNHSYFCGKKLIIAECIIPEGSAYYTGGVNTGFRSEINKNKLPEGYVSNTIIIDKVIG